MTASAAAGNNNNLQQQCSSFATLLKEAEHCVFYTGAGISTSAAIPDFRSPTGLYEQFKNSGTIPLCADIASVRPAFTHMAIKALVDSQYVNHVVSQNCDGLHIRSGLPSEVLSEIHGNMFAEMCLNCEPPTTYIRSFDTTQGTSYRRHKVVGADQRPCSHCGETDYLYDTVVHCGEYARFEGAAPYRWPEAAENAQNADLVVCIGTSLQVLKSYKCLWVGLTQKRGGKPRAKLVIVNLQPTVKDRQANLVINLNCDEVFRTTCQMLGVQVPDYNPNLDPIHIASNLPTRPKSPPKSVSAAARLSSSPTASLPGWMRATVDQLRRAREKTQRSRRATLFGSRRRKTTKKTSSAISLNNNNSQID